MIGYENPSVTVTCHKYSKSLLNVTDVTDTSQFFLYLTICILFKIKIVGFIEREETMLIRMLLSEAGLWKEPVPRAPPHVPVAAPMFAEPTVDYEFFEKTCV